MTCVITAACSLYLVNGWFVQHDARSSTSQHPAMPNQPEKEKNKWAIKNLAINIVQESWFEKGSHKKSKRNKNKSFLDKEKAENYST